MGTVLPSSIGAPLKQHLGPVLISLVFFPVALLYSVATPVFEAPDEIHHYEFVKYVADGHGLPVQQLPPAISPARQEGSQPPLYYALGALLTFWIDTGSSDTLYQLNPHAKVGQPDSDGNKNIVIHTDEEDFPYRGVSLAVHLVRLLSVVLSLITVIATYFTTLEIWPGRKDMATATAAFVALLPGFLFIGSAVNNDSLVIAVSSLALLAMVRLIKGVRVRKQVVVLAVLAGLGALSKVSGLVILPLALGSLAFVAYQRRDVRLFLTGGGVIVGMWAALAGWWFIRNLVHYGELLGTERMLDIAGRRWPPISLWSLIREEGEGLRWSFWGVFGGFNVIADEWFYHLFDVVGILAALGLVLFVLTGLRRRNEINSGLLLLLGAWFLVILGGVLRWSQVALASQGRLLYPAISAGSIFVVLGLASYRLWIPRRVAHWAPGGALLALLAVAVMVPFFVLMPAYAKPAALSADEVPPNLQRLGITYGQHMELIGYEPLAEGLKPGQALDLTLYWRSLSPMEANYSIFVHVFGRAEELLGAHDRYPGRGTFPTSQWRPGTIVKERFRIPLEGNSRPPIVARIEVGLYQFETMERLPAVDAQGIAIGTTPVVARFALRGPEIPPDQGPVRWSFEGQVGLVDFTVEGGSLRAGDVLRGAITWKSLTKPSQDYTMFVQLIDPEGQVGPNGLVAQWDAQPKEGHYPTSFWQPGEVISEPFLLSLPPDLPPKTYHLIAGLYQLESGRRLHIGAADYVLLKEIRWDGQSLSGKD